MHVMIPKRQWLFTKFVIVVNIKLVSIKLVNLKLVNAELVLKVKLTDRAQRLYIIWSYII